MSDKTTQTAAPAQPAAIMGGEVTIRYMTAEGYEAAVAISLSDGRDVLRVERSLSERIRSLGGRALSAPVSAAPSADTGAPICAIHGKPMQRRTGPKGSFWSCPEKLPDGQWCPYRPK